MHDYSQVYWEQMGNRILFGISFGRLLTGMTIGGGVTIDLCAQRFRYDCPGTWTVSCDLGRLTEVGLAGFGQPERTARLR